MKIPMLSLLICGLLLFSLVQPARAQRESPDLFQSRRVLGLRLGMSRLQMQDRNASSLVYSGNIPTLGLQYRAQGENGLFLAGLQAGRGGLLAKSFPGRSVLFMTQDIYGHTDTVAVPMRGTSTLGRLELGYLRQLNQHRDLQWMAGGLLTDEVFYQQGFVTPGLMNVATVSPALQMNWTGGGSYFFSAGISIPIAALVSRGAYHNSVSLPGEGKIPGFFKQGTEVESLGRHRQIKFSTAVHYKLGDHWSAGLEYDFRSVKNTDPRALTILQHELGMSVNFF